ncbi:hypothetical protein V2J09_016018 [Rumex salicifolius]
MALNVNEEEANRVAVRVANQVAYMVDPLMLSNSDAPGYPDWYKGKKSRKGFRMAANVDSERNYEEDTPLKHNSARYHKAGMDHHRLVNVVTNLSSVGQEVMKAFQFERAMHVVAKKGPSNYHFAVSGPASYLYVLTFLFFGKRDTFVL